MQLFSEAEDYRPSLLHKNVSSKQPSIREVESFEQNDSAEDIIDSAPRDTFEKLGLAPWLCKTTKAMGFRKPTQVQCACIPAILQRKDVFACAETGSGKTASPMLQILAEDSFGIFGIILTPTRKLALQISEQITVLGAAMNVTSALIIGGSNLMEQGLKLSRRPHFVIATPGRLRHHLEGGDPPSIARARFLVLDEADRLLALGFSAELAIILGLISPKRQTLLFSATLTQSLGQLREVMRAGGDYCLCLDLAARSGRRLPVSLQQYYVDGLCLDGAASRTTLYGLSAPSSPLLKTNTAIATTIVTVRVRGCRRSPFTPSCRNPFDYGPCPSSEEEGPPS